MEGSGWEWWTQGLPDDLEPPGRQGAEGRRRAGADGHGW